MSYRNALPGLAVIFAALCIPAASALSAETAADRFDEGTALLAESRFDASLESFAAAAKAEPDNQLYRQQYSLVRRVIQIRGAMDEQKDPATWERLALALRAFYRQNAVYSEALAIDQERHERQDTVDSAIMLAESQLELSMNTEAIGLLAEFDDDQTPRIFALHAIALARLGETEKAKAMLGGCESEGEPDPALCLDVACVHALVGDLERAAKKLTCSFEHTLPTQLGALKSYARQRADLETLLDTAQYETVWETESKVKESGCSGGEDCGNCPSKGNCEDGKTHHTE